MLGKYSVHLVYLILIYGNSMRSIFFIVIIPAVILSIWDHYRIPQQQPHQQTLNRILGDM